MSVKPYLHPVVLGSVRGKQRGSNFVVHMLVGVGGMSRSFFTKPRNKKRRRDLSEALAALLKLKPDLTELVVGEARRRGWLERGS